MFGRQLSFLRCAGKPPLWSLATSARQRSAMASSSLQLGVLTLIASLTSVACKSDDPIILSWHRNGTFPRFHESENEDYFAFSEALAASIHLIVVCVQGILCYYCNYQLENTWDEDDEVARKLNPLYKWEALLHAPVTALWLLSGHTLGIWVLVPALVLRIFWYSKKRQGIDLRAQEPIADTSFRTILMMVGHIVSSIIVGGRLYWPRVQLDMTHMDIASEYAYIAAQGVSSVVFLVVWFCFPSFMFKVRWPAPHARLVLHWLPPGIPDARAPSCHRPPPRPSSLLLQLGSHFLGAGLVSSEKKND